MCQFSGEQRAGPSCSAGEAGRHEPMSHGTITGVDCADDRPLRSVLAADIVPGSGSLRLFGRLPIPGGQQRVRDDDTEATAALTVDIAGTRLAGRIGPGVRPVRHRHTVVCGSAACTMGMPMAIYAGAAMKSRLVLVN